MIKPDHLRTYVINPALDRLGARYKNDDAVELLLMIAAHESHLGTYLHQEGGGPAVGIYQMEPRTFHDILVHYVKYNRVLEQSLGRFYEFPNPAYMAFDLSFATAMARVHLYRVPSKLPDRRDIRGMAEYAKEHWNTHLGAATVEDYEKAYVEMVLEEDYDDYKNRIASGSDDE